MATDARDHDHLVRVRGARVHNLRDVDVDVPRNCLVAFTGVSGSGKSSLAFGTIFAESQRRYLESIAPYARRLIQQVASPAVDDVTGLPPAVGLQQRGGGGASSRSSVGTITTVSNTLRMLFSRSGTYPAGGSARLDSDAFSPNTATGACPQCHGMGVRHETTESTLVHDPNLSIRDGAVTAYPGAWQGKNQRDILAILGHDVDAPWHELPQPDRDWILFTDEQPVVTVVPVREAHRHHRPYQGTFMSARRYVMRALTMSQSSAQRRRALRFVATSPCPACNGSRLRPDALAVTVAGCDIAQLGRMSLEQLAETLEPVARDVAVPEVGRSLAADVVARVAMLVELGLGYLALDRATPTLSPGELQRLRLATQLRSGLFGVVYVLDEPSAGLHPADSETLHVLFERLIAAGNSLFVVEHDMDVVRRADWVVDVGPGAGERGGEVLYSGPVEGLASVASSATRRYLHTESGARREPATRRQPTAQIMLSGITRHNLRNLSVAVPLGVFTAVTGVSGSGKSTLVTQVLASVVAAHAGPHAADGRSRSEGDDGDDGPEGALLEVDDPTAGVRADGLDAVDRLVLVDQRPIGRTPRSNLATYTGLFDGVRAAFAATDEARVRGWAAGRFSFNVAGGRCETCQGEGFVAVELLFLPGSYTVCPTCEGSRYAPATLEVHWRGMSVADVLALTVDDAAERFADVRALARSLVTLQQVGLGYLRLGQPATELSGGEAQRIKLASELQRARRGHTLYVLDEPTTGLHPADVELLVAQLHGLVDGGNSVVVVEHDMDVVAGADWVIDMGPGGGDAGGQVLVAGTPELVAATADSATGRFLPARFGRR